MDATEQQSGTTTDVMGELEGRLGPQFEMARERLTAFNQRAMTLMRTYPGTTLICAVGLGFLVGRLASRR